jgi:hypothetical protein
MRARAVDIGRVRAVPKTDAVRKVTSGPNPNLWIGFTVVFTIVAFPPPSLRVTSLVGRHAPASRFVAAPLGIQVRVSLDL